MGSRDSRHPRPGAIHRRRVAGLSALVLTFGLAACEGPLDPETNAWSDYEFDFSQDIIAFESQRDGNREIYLMAADGSDGINLTNHPAADGDAAWSPDGSKIAFASNRDGNTEIYVMNADGSEVTRLTDDPAIDRFPSWSPDGRRIAFSSDRGGDTDIYLMNPDGSELLRLTSDPAEDAEPAWLADGSLIVFFSTRSGNGEIWCMNPDGSNPVNLPDDPAFDSAPATMSRSLDDPARISFVSDRAGGNLDIYTMDVDGS
ncbi:MAG: hypothetical protein R3246_14600, partial [Acidimicrobiia bacterium]|nr:hypothetical protein [Acidimicrobiia bacterium]